MTWWPARSTRCWQGIHEAAWLALALLPALALAQDMVTRDGVTLTQAQETRAEAIGDQLRCLVCQNESIEESNAKLAGQLRGIIRRQVVQGVPDQSIMNYMVQRYGIFVLLKPPVSPLTWLLYAMPVLALLLGGCRVLGGAAQARHPLPRLPTPNAPGWMNCYDLRHHAGPGAGAHRAAGPRLPSALIFAKPARGGTGHAPRPAGRVGARP